MSKKVCILSIIITCLFIYCLSATETVPLAGHLNPSQLLVNDDNIYVIEMPVIYIYSKKDFKLKKKFGKKGEGPKEFKMSSPYSVSLMRCYLDCDNNRLLVNSLGKLSIFTSEGEYIKEMNYQSITNFNFLGEKYIALHSVDEDNNRYTYLSIYNEKLQREKNLLKKLSIVQRTSGGATQWHFFSVNFPSYWVTKEKIFFSGFEKDFKIVVLDKKGEKCFNIERGEYEKVRFTEAHKQKLLQRYRDNPSTRPDFEVWKKIIKVPEYFPAIRDIMIDHDTLYIMTYKKEGEKTEFFVYTTDGKFKKRIFIPIKPSSSKFTFPFVRDSAPFAFWKGKLYQLVDYDEGETYKLHIDEVKSF